MVAEDISELEESDLSEAIIATRCRGCGRASTGLLPVTSDDRQFLRFMDPVHLGPNHHLDLLCESEGGEV